MKLFLFLTTLAALLASVLGAAVGPNAERMARGLPPLTPHRRAPSVIGARNPGPSSTPSVCSTGSYLQCCNSVSAASNVNVKIILGLLGIKGVADTTLVGLTCASLSNNGFCIAKKACCTDVSHVNQGVAIGCTVVN
ncbi:hypothetical protein JAAARDRAFT_36339 [Jaapia argillacea MUCL 33604]|uniref:Hydrophobin n=1 Tax=Jaapia argillacea MUCL 33604 TaxID=933084 RepID=A0A067Q017_9AGAM|nr:hypothetical protein JAAARDRAFT_36339 [Jaapia argillacea MUCL 33604]